MNDFEKLPRPSPDQELYRDTLAKGFAAFPERESNYRRFRQSGRAEVVEYLPVLMDIENVSRCNYSCRICQSVSWPNRQRAADMGFADFQALLEMLPSLVEIKLQGVGEPLLGEDFFRMVALARSRHIWVRSTTNASLLHLNDNHRRLLDADICEIQISMDGATAATYESLRRGGRFDRVTANCRLLNEYGQATGRRRSRMWVVVQKENFAELELFPALAAELGFERLTFSLQVSDYNLEAMKDIQASADVSHLFNLELGERLVELGRQAKVDTTFWFISSKYDRSRPEGLCPWSFHRAYISSDMRIVPCCMICNPEVFDLGDARRFREEWNGPAFRAFRRAHLTGQLPQACQGCYQ